MTWSRFAIKNAVRTAMLLSVFLVMAYGPTHSDKGASSSSTEETRTVKGSMLRRLLSVVDPGDVTYMSSHRARDNRFQFVRNSTTPSPNTTSSTTTPSPNNTSSTTKIPQDVGTNCQDINAAVDQCAFVSDNCQDVPTLFDYLHWRYCDMDSSEGHVLIYILYFSWLAMLISLLATTAGTFFMPSLEYLSEALKLSPSVAGITLLALGNGAPDVFTAMAGVAADDFKLVLSATLGASLCISSFVLGAVILLTPGPETGIAVEEVRRSDFFRDASVYLFATIIIAIVVSDLKVYIYESLSFLIIYVAYVLLVVFRTRKDKELLDGQLLNSDPSEEEMDTLGVSIQEEDGDPDYLEGLDWPADAGLGGQVQFVFEYPFSLFRWMTTPSCISWGPRKRIFACSVPIPLACLILLDAQGTDGFSLMVGKFPLVGILISIGGALSIALFITSNARSMPPYHAVYGLLAFVSAVVWLDLLANETVSLLQSVGVMWNVSSAILGLTVLAMGNSVGDFVADTAVARKGVVATAIASCFGSPLLNDVVGLGISLTISCVRMYPEPFPVQIVSQVKIAWGFLWVALISSLVCFPLFKFKPPKLYGMYLMVIYIAFIIAAVVNSVSKK